MNRPTVLLLVKSTCPPYGWEEDQTPKVYREWIPFDDMTAAEAYIAACPQPGWRQDYSEVEYHLHEINPTPCRLPIRAVPLTMIDKALSYKERAPGIEVGLNGPGQDGPAVHWDGRGNSFAIVRPREDHDHDRRLVSDQGVLLMSINGIGEIRWTVYDTQAGWPENKEAVEHFGLTWSKDHDRKT
jgi:hypothetical protein